MNGTAMRTIASAGFCAALAICAFAFVTAPVSALETPAISPAVQHNVIEVQLRCREWVATCLKRFGGGPRYSRCLRNHGC